MKALIIDDEPMSSKYLLEMVTSHCFEISSTTVYNVASKALEHLKDNVYDIIFLDIEMPGMNGFEFLTHAGLSNRTSVIFTTAYSQYAIEAFKANASHYLLKPVMEEDLIHAVRRASRLTSEPSSINQENADLIHIFDGEDYLIINKSDIIRLEADGSYTKFITKNAPPILSSKRLNQYLEQMDSKKYFRCHNSHVICLNEIIKINRGRAGYIELKNKDLIPVSQSKKEELKKLLGF